MNLLEAENSARKEDLEYRVDGESPREDCNAESASDTSNSDIESGDSGIIYHIQWQLVSSFRSQFLCHFVQPLLILADDPSERLAPQ